LEVGEMKKAIWLGVVIFLGAISSLAQEAPQGDVSTAYSYVHFGPGSNANGGSFSGAVYANHWFGIAGDFGAYSQSLTNTFTFLVGPRFSVRGRGRFTPYAETLFGDTHFKTSGFPSTNGFTALAGGGVELGMSRSVALRPQLDYLAIRSGGSTLNAARVSVGLAFRIGSLPRQ
jgi:hypothetical protein